MVWFIDQLVTVKYKKLVKRRKKVKRRPVYKTTRISKIARGLDRTETTCTLCKAGSRRGRILSVTILNVRGPKRLSTCFKFEWLDSSVLMYWTWSFKWFGNRIGPDYLVSEVWSGLCVRSVWWVMLRYTERDFSRRLWIGMVLLLWWFIVLDFCIKPHFY